MGCGQKDFQLVWRCHQLLSGFQRPLSPSVASVTSVANDKGDNEIILGAVHRSPGICLTAEENPRKPQLVYCLMKGLCDQLSPQMGSLPPNEVGAFLRALPYPVFSSTNTLHVPTSFLSYFIFQSFYCEENILACGHRSRGKRGDVTHYFCSNPEVGY